MKKDRFTKITQAGVQAEHGSDIDIEDTMQPQRAIISGTKRMLNARLISIDKIRPDPNQPRKSYDKGKLNELADSIYEHGMLQPITVEHIELEDYYKIINGERRWEAAKLTDLGKIACIVLETSQEGRYAKQLVENFQREDFSPIDKARALLEFRAIMQGTWEQVEAKLGISEQMRKRFVRLLDLPEKMQNEVVSMGRGGSHDGIVTEKHARALLKLKKQPERQRELFELIKEQKMTGEQAMAWVGVGPSQQVFRCKYTSKRELLDILRNKIKRLEVELGN